MVQELISTLVLRHQLSPTQITTNVNVNLLQHLLGQINCLDTKRCAHDVDDFVEVFNERMCDCIARSTINRMRRQRNASNLP